MAMQQVLSFQASTSAAKSGINSRGPVYSRSNITQGSAIVALSFSPRDGSILAAADESGEIVIWRLSSRLSTVQLGEMTTLESLGSADDEEPKKVEAKANLDDCQGPA